MRRLARDVASRIPRTLRAAEVLSHSVEEYQFRSSAPCGQIENCRLARDAVSSLPRTMRANRDANTRSGCRFEIAPDDAGESRCEHSFEMSHRECPARCGRIEMRVLVRDAVSSLPRTMRANRDASTRSRCRFQFAPDAAGESRCDVWFEISSLRDSPGRCGRIESRVQIFGFGPRLPGRCGQTKSHLTRDGHKCIFRKVRLARTFGKCGGPKHRPIYGRNRILTRNLRCVYTLCATR